MVALHYHHATKHHFNRFARSLGYLDWATQPDPFRRYAGAPVIALSRDVVAGDLPYSALYRRGARAAQPIDDQSIAEFLRCSMGLSAWKQYRQSRWALRVNPSSGNLHPTEAYSSETRTSITTRRASTRSSSAPTFDRPAWDGVHAGPRAGFSSRSRRFSGARRGNTASARSATASTTPGTRLARCAWPRRCSAGS